MTWNVSKIILFSSVFDIHSVKTEVEKDRAFRTLEDAVLGYHNKWMWEYAASGLLRG